MISKPLFKQSVKANFGVWSFVTAINCIMVAILIIVLGNLNVSEIRDSMADMFIKDALEATIEERSMNFYRLTDTALSNYEVRYNQLNNLFNVQLNNEVKANIINSYNFLITSGQTDSEARSALTANQPEFQVIIINTLLDYYLVNGEDYSSSKITEYVLTRLADAMYDELVESEGEEAANTAITFIRTAINDYVNSQSTNVTEFATNYIPQVLKEVFYNQTFENKGKIIAVADYFTKERINELSYSAIVSFRAELDVKEKQIREANPGYTDAEVLAELESHVNEIISERSKTLIDSLPKKVADALTELGDMDMSTLVIGTIFYRISGLLLPMIFVIMAANNLIAGQVDSGSMAYVLSTPIKRKKVTVTQMAYLVTSLFAMFVLMAITSVVSLAVVSDKGLTLTYSQLLQLNLGAFITLLAVSGICFFTSCWFNRSKLAMSTGGGLTMFFLVATILGLFGSSVIPSAVRVEAMRYFNYFSLVSLFDATAVLDGKIITFLWKIGILIIVGIVTYFFGIEKFDKKDLPL